MKAMAGRARRSRCRSATKARASWSRPARRRRRRRCSARRSPCSAARCTRSTACIDGRAVPAAARRHDAGRRRLVLRQPADRAGHGRDDAARGPHGAGAHRGGVEPRPDAATASASPTASAWSTSCASREQADAAARARREARVQLAARPTFMRGPDRGAGRHRRHARLRRHRRRQAGRPDPRRAWKRRSTGPPRNTAATARPRTSRSTSTAASTPARPSSTRNFGMAWGIGGWLLFPFLQKIGAGGGAAAARARRRRAEDDLRQPLHADGLAGRGAAASTRSPSTAGAPPARSDLIAPGKGVADQEYACSPLPSRLKPRGDSPVS